MRRADSILSDICILTIAGMMLVFAVLGQDYSDSSHPGPHTARHGQQALHVRKYDGDSSRSTAAGASPAHEFPPRSSSAVVVYDQPKEAAEEL